MSALKFERQPMVRWLEPGVLVDAALRVVLSGVFGEYSDKRESLAVADEHPRSYADKADPATGAFWLDYVSDLGDGFDSTYAVACLLGAESLSLPGLDEPLPRGHVLVMGGDEVYPTPSRKEYEDRFRGPYEAALPWVPGREDADAPPHLYAIPGNHDWYDGLTNFPRFFCSDRQVGGWQTRQKRSYFALELPHDWWLFAIDIQLDTYIDDPQMTFFKEVAERLTADHRVILVTGKPSWLKVEEDKPLEKQPDSYKNLRYFVSQVIEPTGASVPVTISGDLHHYSHYHAEGSHLITAGGGGAYLFPTHTQPERLAIPGEDSTPVVHECELYPSREESRDLVGGARGLRKLAPNLIRVLAVIYALLGTTLFWALDEAIGWWVAVTFLLLIFGGGLVVYAALENDEHKPDWPRKLLVGTLHAVPHLFFATLPAVVMHIAGPDEAVWGLAAGAASFVLGLIAAGPIFGQYLVSIHERAPKHANDVLACQGIPDYKNFLRLRIDADGLRIHPIGLRRVPREWEPDGDGGPSDPWLRPKEGRVEDSACLIETPIDVPERPPAGGFPQIGLAPDTPERL